MPDDEVDAAPASRLGGEEPRDMGQDDIEPLNRTAPVTPPPAPLSSPSLSSPVSLYQLGITPLRRQFSSPRAGFSPSSLRNGRDGGVTDSDSDQDDDDLTQDTRDVLVQRLADLMKRLTQGHDFNDENITALHHKVDEMEGVLAGKKARSPRKRMSRPMSLDLDAPAGSDTGRLWGMPSPWLRSRISDLAVPGEAKEAPAPVPAPVPVPVPVPAPVPKETEPKRKPAISGEQANQIAEEAEKLNMELTALVTKLRARQEESDHIHALLIERAERAAQRIIMLQERVQDLEEDLHENDTELTSLRVALKAIEIQCPPPADMDEDLRQSIQNWKTDWKNLREKRAKKTGDDQLGSSFSTPRTPR